MRSKQPGTRTGHVCDEAFRPYRDLAIRVLARAWLDLTDPAGSAVDRESARVFLTGSGMLVHWCRVAALDPSTIANRAEKFATATTRAGAYYRPPLALTDAASTPPRIVVGRNGGLHAWLDEKA